MVHPSRVGMSPHCHPSFPSDAEEPASPLSVTFIAPLRPLSPRRFHLLVKTRQRSRGSPRGRQFLSSGKIDTFGTHLEKALDRFETGGNLRSAQDIVEALELGTVHRWRTLAVHGWRASDAERLKSLGPAGQDQSKAPSFGLFVGDLQPLPFPGALDPSVADRPTRLVQQSCNLAIAVAAIVAGQRNDVGHQPFAILTALGNVGRTLMWSAATTKDFATI
jgi:hypothetical protein